MLFDINSSHFRIHPDAKKLQFSLWWYVRNSSLCRNIISWSPNSGRTYWLYIRNCVMISPGQTPVRDFRNSYRNNCRSITPTPHTKKYSQHTHRGAEQLQEQEEPTHGLKSNDIPRQQSCRTSESPLVFLATDISQGRFSPGCWILP